MKYSTTGLEQACEGSANEDHLAMGIIFAIANQKRARNVKRPCDNKTLDTALLFVKLVKSFTIAILKSLIDCEFPLTHCSLPQTMLSLVVSLILKEQLAYRLSLIIS